MSQNRRGNRNINLNQRKQSQKEIQKEPQPEPQNITPEDNKIAALKAKLKNRVVNTQINETSTTSLPSTQTNKSVESEILPSKSPLKANLVQLKLEALKKKPEALATENKKIQSQLIIKQDILSTQSGTDQSQNLVLSTDISGTSPASGGIVSNTSKKQGLNPRNKSQAQAKSQVSTHPSIITLSKPNPNLSKEAQNVDTQQIEVSSEKIKDDLHGTPSEKVQIPEKSELPLNIQTKGIVSTSEQGNEEKLSQNLQTAEKKEEENIPNLSNQEKDKIQTEELPKKSSTEAILEESKAEEFDSGAGIQGVEEEGPLEGERQDMNIETPFVQSDLQKSDISSKEKGEVLLHSQQNLNQEENKYENESLNEVGKENEDDEIEKLSTSSKKIKTTGDSFLSNVHLAEKSSPSEGESTSSKLKKKLMQKEAEKIRKSVLELEKIVKNVENRMPRKMQNVVAYAQSLNKKRPFNQRFAKVLSFFENYQSS